MFSRSAKATLFFLVALSGACTSISSYPKLADAAVPFSASDADPEIKTVIDFIAKAPDSATGYQQLAIIYIKRARRTGDFSLNSKARSAVEKGLEISASDVALQKIQATLYLTFHQFDEALALGTKLATEYPSDAIIYGILTDANVELGNYDAAVANVQKMVDLRPNSASYARVAHVRSLHGDHDGAVEMFKLAARTADPQDKEAQSWCLTYLGDEYWKHGKYVEAEKVYDEALNILPDYYLAAVGKGRILASRGDYQNAVRILTETSERIPNIDALIMLGDIHTKLGDTAKAKQNYDLVEVVESKIGVNNDQKRLALMWSNNNVKIDEALSIAVREHDLRKDINTADALAWAHYKKGNFAEAKIAIKEALRLNSNEARSLYHAGMIEKALGNRTAAQNALENAIKLNPNFDIIQSQIAQDTLAELKAGKR